MRKAKKLRKQKPLDKMTAQELAREAARLLGLCERRIKRIETDVRALARCVNLK